MVIPFFILLLIFAFLFAINKRRLLAIFTLLLFVATNYFTQTIPINFNSCAEENKKDLKVLCYNVRCLDSLYPKNEIKIAQQILAETPDVVFLCEFTQHRNRRLDSILIKNAYLKYYKRGTNCAFYSKYEIDRVKSIITNNLKRKYSLNIMVHANVKGKRVTIIGCHLSSSHHHLLEGYYRRKKEADALYEIIEEESDPVIVLGDLNDISGSYTIRRIQEAGLYDAWWEGGCGYGTTFHDGWLRLRLDHVLYQDDKLKLQYVKIIDSDLSDHNAVVAGFTLKNWQYDNTCINK